MPTWGEILQELHTSVAGGDLQPFDSMRRKYLASTFHYTQRNVILYATRFTQDLPPGVSPNAISITDEDLQGLMEVIHGLSGPDLDLILHSPGGSAEAAEAMVSYLRSKFRHIRVIVPSLAMSAATMLCCAADVVVMGKHSFLGPIDPQFILNTPLGQRAVPAQAIIEQFDRAQRECQDPAKMAAWLPMLAQFGPDLLIQCEHALDKSVEMVRNWLKAFMFNNIPDGDRKASEIADWLGNHAQFRAIAATFREQNWK